VGLLDGVAQAPELVGLSENPAPVSAFAEIGRLRVPIPHPLNWLDRPGDLLARELTPIPHKLRTALRIATVATIEATVVASCHVNNEFGIYCHSSIIDLSLSFQFVSLLP
jgi:hypothetical protein